MIAPDVQHVEEKVGTRVIGDRPHARPALAPQLASFVRDHLSDLGAIARGLSDVDVSSPPGKIARKYGGDRRKPMNETQLQPAEKTLTQRVLEVFQDGKEHNAQEIANALGSDHQSVHVVINRYEGRKHLVKVRFGVYKVNDGQPMPEIRAPRMRKAPQPAKKELARIVDQDREEIDSLLKTSELAASYKQQLLEERRLFVQIALRDAADFVSVGDLEHAHLKILLAQQRMVGLVNLEKKGKAAR